MDIISLPIEYEQAKIDSRFRVIAIASQRAKELAVGAQTKVKTKSKKVSTVALEETITNTVDFLIGEDAKKAREEAKRFDYRKLLEERKKELAGEGMSELEKDLKVYLNQKETADKSALEGLFSEKREDDTEE